MWNLVETVLLSASLQLVSAGDIGTLPIQLLITNSKPTLAAQAYTLSDTTATQSVKTLLSTLRQAGYIEAAQGVWLQSNNGVLLASHQPNKALPAASLTKIATTLAALTTWPTNYQFPTMVNGTGRLVGDTWQGNLIIDGSGDPFFVWEEGIGLANAIQQLGIRRIQGDLIIGNGFFMNFEDDPIASGNFLKQSFDANQWSEEIWSQYRTLPSNTPRPQLTISGSVRYSPFVGNQGTPLVKHASLPLWQIIKRMNTFSNNVMADALATNLGGASTVVQKVTSSANIPYNEIRLINGSGLGQENQISPHAVVAMLIAIQNIAQSQNLSLADLFPTSACNCGTIEGRSIPVGAIVKTGTLSDVSALAGVVQTRDRGPVWFAIINRGEGDIGFFHEAQDKVLRTLVQKWGVKKDSPLGLGSPFSVTRWQDSNRNQLLTRLR